MYLLKVSVLPHEENTVLGLFCHWQNTTDTILDLNRTWIWNCQFVRFGFEFWNEFVGMDLDLKNINPIISDQQTREVKEGVW